MRSPMVIIAYLTASLCLPSFFFPHSLPQNTAYEISCKENSVKICFQGKPLCGIMWSILSIKCLQEIDNSISTGLNNKKTLLSHVTWSPEVGLLQGSLIQWLTRTIQSPKFLSFSSAILSMVALYLSLAFLTLTKMDHMEVAKGKGLIFSRWIFFKTKTPFPRNPLADLPSVTGQKWGSHLPPNQSLTGEWDGLDLQKTIKLCSWIYLWNGHTPEK